MAKPSKKLESQENTLLGGIFTGDALKYINFAGHPQNTVFLTAKGSPFAPAMSVTSPSTLKNDSELVLSQHQ